MSTSFEFSDFAYDENFVSQNTWAEAAEIPSNYSPIDHEDRQISVDGTINDDKEALMPVIEVVNAHEATQIPANESNDHLSNQPINGFLNIPAIAILKPQNSTDALNATTSNPAQADALITTSNLGKLAVMGTAGGVVGAGLVAVGFLAVGLIPFVGPYAGGLFAANMGAGVASGSLMALAQSAAMTPTIYAFGAATTATGVGAYWLHREHVVQKKHQ
jgi:hypothetical protein